MRGFRVLPKDKRGVGTNKNPQSDETSGGKYRASVEAAKPLDDPAFVAWARKRGVAPTTQKRNEYDKAMADMLSSRLSRWIKGVSVKTVNFIAPEEETSSATDRASKVSYPRMASIKSVEDAMPGQMTSDSLAKAIKKRKEAENSLGDFIAKPDAEINPHHIVSDLGRAIGMTRNAPSLYRSYMADDGSVFSIRLSNHRANADNYVDKKNAAKVNISIAVIRDRSGEFKPNDTVELREYEYNESDLTIDDVKKIAQSLRDAIANGGIYADTTGKLIIENVSPSNTRNSIEKIYTGSTADYANRSRQGGVDDGPSLHKIGTGEGTQNEAWGLYGTDAPGIAGRYANQDVYLLPKILYRNGREIPNKQYDFLESAQSTYESMRLKKESHEKTMEVLRQNLESRAEARMNRLEIDPDVFELGLIDAIKYGEQHGSEYEVKDNPNQKHAYVYEQIFFTNRPDGDESHLIVWDKAVDEKLLAHIKKALDIEISSGSGEDVYNQLADILGGKKQASEFLRDKCNIDGIKYPSPASEGAGHQYTTNYISFRDDNIRVVHKWKDSQRRYLHDGERIVGSYNRATGEVKLAKGASVETVLHELGWHAARHLAEVNADSDPKAANLLNQMREYAESAPEDVKKVVRDVYGDLDADTLLDEIGAARFTKEQSGKIAKAIATKEGAAWYKKLWNKVVDFYKNFLTKIGYNRVDLDGIEYTSPDVFGDFLADVMMSGKQLGERTAFSMEAPKGLLAKWTTSRSDYKAPIAELEKRTTGSSNNIYYLARTLEGMAQRGKNRAERAIKRVEKILGEDVSPELLAQYMQLKAYEERNAKIERRNGKADASGMTPEDAKAIEKTINESGVNEAIFEEAAQILWDLQNEGLQARVDAGLLDQETANKWMTDEPHHIPWKDAVDPDSGEYVGRRMGASEFDTAEGRKTAASGDPITWMLQEYQDAISFCEDTPFSTCGDTPSDYHFVFEGFTNSFKKCFL